MNEMERDPRVDAAWRAASSEQPSPALDAAIRAAARRAVEAGPRRKRDKHWWYPLAAAATVAVIAVGLLQLTPPEQVAPTVVAEMTAPKKEAVPATPPSSTVAPAFNKDAVDALQAPAPAQNPQPSAPAQSSPPRRQLDEADQRAKAAMPAPAAAEAPKLAAPPRSEPFPGTPPAEPRARRDAAISPEPQNAMREQAAASGSVAAPSPMKPAPIVAGGVANEPAAAEEKRASAAKALAKDADVGGMKQKTARSVDDWVKEIRRLRDEGRYDEAAKELAAFRSAYGERAEALLPADLKQFAPPGTAGAK
jgi:hypothetical protein